MVLKRTDTDESLDCNNRSALAVETLRMSRPAAEGKSKADEEKLSIFWRLFGGTILSIVALAGLTLYNNLTSNISELRGEVSRLNEAKAEWAKKDDVQGLRTQITAQSAYRAEIDSLKERTAKYRTELDESKKETRAGQDAIRKDLATIDGVKEKLAALTFDCKAALEETAKLRAELGKNQSADLARQEVRDSQLKKLDETFKDLQKTITEAREKIARIEGQQTPMKTVAGKE